MPGLHHVGGRGAGGHGGLHGAGAVGGGDAGGHARGRFDGHGKGSAEHAAVARHHLLQAQPLTVFIGQGQADQAARFAGHETDCLGVAAVGGKQQVAFVFPVFIVHQQDHLALPVVFEDLFDAVKGHGISRCGQ
ncbi:hypothetical protein D3C85_1087130 [compost metagenome]